MVATTRCPRGHASTDADFCSDCGVRMASAPAGVEAAATAPAQAAAGICPDCGTARVPGARYCEVCRYDHEQGAATVHAARTASAGRPEAPAAASVSAPPSRRLYAVVAVDPQQAREQGVPEACPADRPPQRFPLDLAETLIGRRSERRGIYPELDLADAGASHRHLMLLRQPDRSFAVLDLGSSNGTRLNGAELRQGVAVPVKAGDELRLGIWTRITIEES